MMDALSEMLIALAMIVIWALELFYSLLGRDPGLIILSFLLLLLWLDELFPVKKEVRIGFNTRLALTALIVLTQQITRFFL